MSRAKLKRAAATPAIVGGAALATAAAVAFTTAVPQVVSRESVELTATITPGSATNWNADGIDEFYGVDWNATYGPTAIAPFRLIEFWQSAENILKALDAAQSDEYPDVVVSSGRGAGNASAAITWLAATDPDGSRLNDTFWILDNNVDRPNGGYATRYPFFALVGVNPVPVPNDLEGVQILDVGYQYAWNSSAPTYISNLPALLNAIIAYAYRYRQQDKLPIPEEILNSDGTLNPTASGYYVVRTDGSVEQHPFDDPDSKVTTVYVTYEANGLPMLQPIRDFGGDFGNAFADVVEPVLTVLVNASYTDNNPLADPSVYTPMQLIAPPKVWAKAAGQLPGALAEGWNNLQDHLGGGGSDETTVAESAPTELTSGEKDSDTTEAVDTPKPLTAVAPEDDAAEADSEADDSEETAEESDRTRRLGSGPIAKTVQEAVANVTKRLTGSSSDAEDTDKADKTDEADKPEKAAKAAKDKPASDSENSAKDD